MKKGVFGNTYSCNNVARWHGMVRTSALEYERIRQRLYGWNAPWAYDG